MQSPELQRNSAQSTPDIVVENGEDINAAQNDRPNTGQVDALRLLNRSPHPYLLNFDRNAKHKRSNRGRSSSRLKHETPAASSESGTEADDETERQAFVRALPAPNTRPRKGLKAGEKDEDALLTPNQLDDEGRIIERDGYFDQYAAHNEKEDEEVLLKRRLNEFARRCSEIALVGVIMLLVFTGRGVWSVVRHWQLELAAHIFIMIGLVLAYPIRLSMLDTRTDAVRPWQRFRVPASFDPATVLYPPLLPVLVAFAVSPINRAIVVPNIILGLASLPQRLFPRSSRLGGFNTVHWVVSILPLVIGSSTKWAQSVAYTTDLGLSNETLVSLYPLHHALLHPLHYLTTNSLLISELHLLSAALINLLLFARAPQAVILKACLWVGGATLFTLTGRVLHWNVILARVPRWKLRRPGQHDKERRSLVDVVVELINVQRATQALQSRSEDSDADEDQDPDVPITQLKKVSKLSGSILDVDFSKASLFHEMHSRGRKSAENEAFVSDDGHINGFSRATVKPRRFTLPASRATTELKPSASLRKSKRKTTHVPWCLQLTAVQADRRKFIYSIYIYLAVVLIILGPVRRYVGLKALQGDEPIGWAISYLFGQLAPIRYLVDVFSLDFWIHLPMPGLNIELSPPTSLPLDIPALRIAIGASNTRLLLIVYWVMVLTVGLVSVFTLTPYVEVDTRRKVFHGVMVAMFLPATFVDPCYCALALGLVLAIFLLLEVIRAGQVPPLGTAIGRFIAPYVDGRDLRGPVVVSHLFLAIGCAVPLWFSLASMGREDDGPWRDWETEEHSRSVDMLTGVICVGMGDAAASLIGRRYGRRKWAWIGGKSLEGSAAFAFAVTLGLLAGKVWLWLGGWHDLEPVQNSIFGWTFWLWKAMFCACGASFMEAVLTGANDNVVVPVALWLLAKGTRL